MKIEVLEEDFVVCKIESFDEVSMHDKYSFLTKEDQNISLICTDRYCPSKTLGIQKNYRAIKIEGNLEFNSVGVIAKLSSLLALNDISILSVSTFTTEYIFVKNAKLSKAVDVLKANGYELI